MLYWLLLSSSKVKLSDTNLIKNKEEELNIKAKVSVLKYEKFHSELDLELLNKKTYSCISKLLTVIE